MKTDFKVTDEMKRNVAMIQPPVLGMRRVAGKVAGTVASRALRGVEDRYAKSLGDYLEKNKNFKFKSKAPNAILRKLMK